MLMCQEVIWSRLDRRGNLRMERICRSELNMEKAWTMYPEFVFFLVDKCHFDWSRKLSSIMKLVQIANKHSSTAQLPNASKIAAEFREEHMISFSILTDRNYTKNEPCLLFCRHWWGYPLWGEKSPHSHLWSRPVMSLEIGNCTRKAWVEHATNIIH